MIRRLIIQNFRCHSLFELNNLTNVVILEGENGAGKTSVLESISLLGLGKGLRSSPIHDILKFETPYLKSFFALENGTELSYEYDASHKRRKNYIDGKFIKSQQSYLSELRVLWLTPDMDRILAANRVERRKWFDRLVYNAMPEHAYDVLQYEQLLSKRMKMLKQNSIDMLWLDKIEMMLATIAFEIVKRRAAFLARIEKFLDPNLTKWPEIVITFVGKPEEIAADHEFVNLYAKILSNYREKDKLSQRSNFGSHKLDIRIKRDNIDATYLSTGQLKSALIQVMLAHYNMLSSQGVSPILLLDDIFSHFDASIRLSLLELIESNKNNQFWITTTGLEQNFGPNSSRIIL